MSEKRELKSALGGFDLRSHLKSDAGKTAVAAKMEEANQSDKKAAAFEAEENKPLEAPPSAKTKHGRIKREATAASAEDKIPFMNYLPATLHNDFSYLYLEAKLDLRARTGKALSQTELVEAILLYAVENWKTEKPNFLRLAENIIAKRKPRE